MGTEVDLGSFSSAVAGYIEDLKDDAYDKINELERYLHSATVYDDLGANFFAQVTDITFNEISKASDIIENVALEIVPTRDLMPETGDLDKGHTFHSDQLDKMEENLLNLLANAGIDSIKDVSAAFLSDSDIAAIEAAYYEYKQMSLNMSIAILNKYPSADLQGNIDWITERYGFQLTDFQKEFYEQLFEIAQKTTSWIGKQAIAIEQLHANFTASYNSLLNKLVSANVAAYKAEVEANVTNLQNQIIKTDALVDINAMKADQLASELDLKVKQETSRITAYTQHYAEAMSATLENLQINANVSKGVAGAYKAVLAAHSQRYTGVVIGRQ